MDGRALFETWFDRLWRQRDARVIDELRHPDAKSEGLAQEALDNEAFRALHAQVLASFESVSPSIVRFLQEGDQVAMLVRLDAVTLRGKRVTMMGAGFARLEDGLIAEATNLWDVAALAAQLDAEAPPTTVQQIAALAAKH